MAKKLKIIQRIEEINRYTSNYQATALQRELPLRKVWNICDSYTLVSPNGNKNTTDNNHKHMTQSTCNTQLTIVSTEYRDSEKVENQKSR